MTDSLADGCSDTEWFLREYYKKDWTVYQNGLYAVKDKGTTTTSSEGEDTGIRTTRYEGVYFRGYPFNIKDTHSLLLSVTCLVLESKERLESQIRFSRSLKDRASAVYFTNLEKKHVLLHPPVDLTIREWLNRMIVLFKKKEKSLKGTIAEWWSIFGVKIKRIARFLIECLIAMFEEKLTHGDLVNGIALNEDATEIRLFNCKAPPDSDSFNHRVDLDAAIGILIELATMSQHQAVKGVVGVPTWFHAFITNMQACEPIDDKFWGLEIQLLHSALWTPKETLRSLTRFHEHHVKLRAPAPAAPNMASSGAFKWKGAVGAHDSEFAGRVKNDHKGRPYEETFIGMFSFWRIMVYHFNERKMFVEGQWELHYQSNPNFLVKEVRAMEKLESRFPFAETAYNCVRLSFEMEIQGLVQPPIKETDAERDARRKATEARYLEIYGVLKTTESYGGYRNIK